MRDVQVVIVGGGATGTGVARDLALRGTSVVLVEKDGLGSGTTGRCHGLLHSGARYAVEDPEAAAECIAENRVLKRIGTGCVEDVGGLFVALSDEDLAYLERLKPALAAVGIACRELAPAEVKAEEPGISSQVAGGLWVPDGAIDPFRLVAANALDAQAHGAKILEHHAVTGFEMGADGRVEAVVVQKPDGAQERIGCDVVVNASGSWSTKVLALVGLRLEILQSKGSLLVYNRRLTRHVINRCRWPSDGDIVVPADAVTVVGTTSMEVPDPEPDSYGVSDTEVALLMEEGDKLLPALAEARVIRAFAGVRPLANIRAAGAVGDGGGRDVTRRHVLIDHGAHGGPPNMVSIIGGKLTTYRLMAEETADWVSRKLNVPSVSQTALRSLPDVRPPSRRRREVVMPKGAADRHACAEAVDRAAGIVCECERVDEGDLEARQSLDDARRRLRIGMGPCQGTFCAVRYAGWLFAEGRLAQGEDDVLESRGARLILDFLNRRMRGQAPVLWGEQLRQVAFARELYSALYNIDDFATPETGQGGGKRDAVCE